MELRAYGKGVTAERGREPITLEHVVLAVKSFCIPCEVTEDGRIAPRATEES
jgi:hypothetical protein